MLQKAGIPLSVIELNHGLFRQLGRDGVSGVWGDITGPEILEAAQIDNAKVLLLTVPHRNAVELSIQRARELNPDVTIIARAARPDHVADLKAHGANAVVQPEFEGGVEMVRLALVQYPFDEAAAARLVGAVRHKFYEPGD